MKAVYMTTDMMEADFLAMLRGHGIEVMVDGVAGLYPDGLMPAGQPSRLLVHDARSDEARDIIREELSRRKHGKETRQERSEEGERDPAPGKS